MEYNSTREPLKIREYGRNIQKMVAYAITIEDREKRNLAAKTIIQFMSQMNPQTRDQQDYKQKLWDHLFEMSDFKLDVDSPFPKPQKEQREHPKRPSYSNKREIRFSHYGRIIQKIIQRVKQLEEGTEKTLLTEQIANQLKKNYLNFNRDSVNDDVIQAHLSLLSDGELKLDENTRLNNTRDILNKNKYQKNTTGAKGAAPQHRYKQNNNNQNNPHNRNKSGGQQNNKPNYKNNAN